MNKTLSYLSLKRTVENLRAAGIFRLDENSSKIKKNLHTAYMRIVLCSLLLYTFQQMLKVYEVRANVDKVMDTMFLFLTHSDCILKVVVLWKKAGQIEGFLDVMKGPIFNQKEPQHDKILQDTIKKTLLLLYVFNGAALFTCFLWALHPTILHIQEKRIEFPIWLPFDSNSNPQYYIAVIYVLIMTSLVAYTNTTMDIFITFSLEQCRTQLSILRFDLENIVQNSKKEATSSTCSLYKILNRRFYKILIHHKTITDTVDKIQETFGGVLFYQFLVTAWILCTSAYRIVSVDPASIEFVSMLTYILCILTELLLFCFYGHDITTESQMLTESAYAMDWLETPVSLQKSLIIFMERIKRPIQPMAGSYVPLSNNSFISIIRSSYSFYAFLKNSGRSK